jgi:hypothetical protein
MIERICYTMDGNEIHMTRSIEMNYKSILLGDYTNPPYHPLDAMEQELSRILKDQVTVVGTEDYEPYGC